MHQHGIYNLSVESSQPLEKSRSVGLLEERTGVPVALLFLDSIQEEQRWELFSSQEVEMQCHQVRSYEDKQAWRSLLPFFDALGKRMFVVAFPKMEDLMGKEKGIGNRSGVHSLKNYRRKADVAFIPQLSTLLNPEQHTRFLHRLAKFLIQEPHFLFLVDFPRILTRAQIFESVRTLECPDMAAYSPWIVSQNEIYPVTPLVAAAIQLSDEQFGVQQLPTNQNLSTSFAPLIKQTPAQLEEMLQNRINTLHHFSSSGLKLWGGSTLAARYDSDHRFIATRRTLLAIQEVVHQVCEPFVLEPIATGLEKAIDVALQSAFQPLKKLFNQEVSDAFMTQVTIDSTPKDPVVNVQVACHIPYVLGEVQFSLGLAA